jgi:hypothetical protein
VYIETGWTFKQPDNNDVILILPDNSEVNLIVDTLGDHMAHTVKCVREHFIHGIPVQGCLSLLFTYLFLIIVPAVLDSMASDSLRKLERLFGGLSVNSALAAFCLLEALQKVDTLEWTSLFAGKAVCSFAEVYALVQRLIAENILTSPYAGVVALHARILKLAFKNLKAKKNYWGYKFEGMDVKAGRT